MKTDQSEQHYIETGGVACPSCGGDQIGGDSFTTEGCICYQGIICNDCGASWEDVYSLECINNFTEGGSGDWED